MQIPVQVTFRDLPTDDACEALCLEEAAKLERRYDRITSCRVVVSQPHKHHEKGNLWEVHVDLTVPGGEIVATRVPPEHGKDVDLAVAVREAFKKTLRQLDEFLERQRGDMKRH